MENELLTILKSYPTKVAWADVVDPANFDERRSAIDCLVVNSIGVSEAFIEFIPGNEPALREEVLSWIWIIRPDLSKALIELDINEDFRMLLNSYINNNMQAFWNYIS